MASIHHSRIVHIKLLAVLLLLHWLVFLCQVAVVASDFVGTHQLLALDLGVFVLSVLDGSILDTKEIVASANHSLKHIGELACSLSLVSNSVAVVAAVALAAVVSEKAAEATDGAATGHGGVVHLLLESTHVLVVYNKISDLLSMDLLMVYLLEVLFQRVTDVQAFVRALVKLEVIIHIVDHTASLVDLRDFGLFLQVASVQIRNIEQQVSGHSFVLNFKLGLEHSLLVLGVKGQVQLHEVVIRAVLVFEHGDVGVGGPKTAWQHILDLGVALLAVLLSVGQHLVQEPTHLEVLNVVVDVVDDRQGASVQET